MPIVVALGWGQGNVNFTTNSTAPALFASLNWSGVNNNLCIGDYRGTATSAKPPTIALQGVALLALPGMLKRMGAVVYLNYMIPERRNRFRLMVGAKRVADQPKPP
jgi:hypothetical protein